MRVRIGVTVMIKRCPLVLALMKTQVDLGRRRNKTWMVNTALEMWTDVYILN